MKYKNIKNKTDMVLIRIYRRGCRPLRPPPLLKGFLRYFFKKVSIIYNWRFCETFSKVSVMTDYRGGHSQRIFYINSKNRLSGTDSDWTTNVDIRGLDDPNMVKLLHIYIPKSYYSVAAPYNTFILSEDGYETTIELTPGNYSIISLKAKLSALLTADSPNGYTYVVSSNNTNLEPEEGKLTFTVSNNGGIQPQLIFNSITRVHEVMGFERKKTYTFDGGVLKSANVISTTGEHTLYLHSDIVGEGNNNILQEIYTTDDVHFGSVVYESSGSDYGKKLASKNNNRYRFYLTDENDQEINLNGLGIVMTLMVYRETNWYDLFNSFFTLLKGKTR